MPSRSITSDQSTRLVVQRQPALSPFAATALTLSRASPFPPSQTATATAAASTSPSATTSTTSTKPDMATPAFLPQSQQPFRPPGLTSHSPYTLPLNGVHPFDSEANAKPVGTPFATAPSAQPQVLIRRLPPDTTEEKLRLMVVFSQELVDVEMLPADSSEDPAFRAAIVTFKTIAGAQQAKEMLHGKSISKDAEMIVEILSTSPVNSRRYPTQQDNISTNSSAASSTTSSGPTSRQPSRFGNGFQIPMGKVSPPMNSMGGMNTMNSAMYGSNELPNPESSAHYQSLFSPQSPIGNHLTDRARMSGKTLMSVDDDETQELLNNPLAYAENGATQGRRATAPQLPITRMASLSLNTNTAPASTSLPPYGPATVTPLSAHANTMSPTAMNGASHSISYQMGSQPFNRPTFPPMNPADQNPPCNTLYVGNLPIDTSEEELKAMFSKQRGYKRLCFRTKQNGPMCFVEFEDVSFATKALHELYGQPLHNSVKGGIRLSFSKNPLGVRSGQSPSQTGIAAMAGINSMMAGSGAGFTSANGPPPGLAAPPGLNRMAYNAAPSMSSGTSGPYSASNLSSNYGNVWGNSPYNGAL